MVDINKKEFKKWDIQKLKIDCYYTERRLLQDEIIHLSMLKINKEKNKNMISLKQDKILKLNKIINKANKKLCNIRATIII